MEKVLVTGANGFIGSHLVQGLVKNGYEVRALVRSTSNLRWIKDLDLELIYGEVIDYETLLPAVEGVDYIYHLASTTRVVDRTACDRVNCGGTKNLLEACAQNNPNLKRFVFFSSLAACGPSSDSKLVNEDTEPKPVSLYGKTKLTGEEMILGYSKLFPTVIIRPPGVYGPRDTDTLELFKWLKSGIRPYFGGRDGLISLCYVDDLVQASVIAVKRPVASGSIYFISDGEIYNYSTVYKTVEEITGARTIPFPISAGIISLYTHFNRDSSLTQDKARELFKGNWICDISKAKRELGYEPRVPLREGLKRTIDWYQKFGWL